MAQPILACLDLEGVLHSGNLDQCRREDGHCGSSPDHTRGPGLRGAHDATAGYFGRTRLAAYRYSIGHRDDAALRRGR